MTSVTPTVSAPNSATAPLSDLEMRIDPEQTLDLFTMQPKVSRRIRSLADA
jgi:hypothetical protein